MKSILCVSLWIFLIPSAYASELPGDSSEGKRLYDANCMGCHDTGIHTRKEPGVLRRGETVTNRVGSRTSLDGS